MGYRLGRKAKVEIMDEECEMCHSAEGEIETDTGHVCLDCAEIINDEMGLAY